MLWAILYLYLTGGSGGLVYDIEDPVKQYVKVETTSDQIIAINKEMLNEEAVFWEQSAAVKKQLARINANWLATESEFTEIFAALDEQRAAAREKILDDRFKMRELMTAEEWSKVYAAVNQQD